MALKKYFFISLCIYIVYVKDFQVNGAIKIIKNLRKHDTGEANHKDNVDISVNSDESEPGFALNDEDIKKFHMWPRGVIPYYIDDYSFDKVLRDTIRAFLEHTSHMTVLRFVEIPRPPEDDSRWVFFINRQAVLGCADHSFESFTNEGVQKVILGYDCINSDSGLAEVILLLVGVPPQHNAPNRDEFIEIRKDNIIPGKRYLFNVLTEEEWLFSDLDYDFKSAGHYDSHKHTVNGGATIIPKKKISNLDMGHVKCFSYMDVKKIKMLYNFIAKQKDKIRFPECNKMFSPGSNFSKFQYESKEYKPRKKPNKYLGLADEERESHGEENVPGDNEATTVIKEYHFSMSFEHNRQNEDKGKGDKGKGDNGKGDKGKGDKGKGNKGKGNKGKEGKGKGSKGKGRHKIRGDPLSLKSKHKNQHLLDLSDFGTEEGH